MKKLLIGLLTCLLLFISCVYIFIPSKITVSSISIVKASVSSTQRYFSDKPYRIKWWPYNDTARKDKPGKNVSFYKGYYFGIPLHLSNSTVIVIGGNKKDINSTILFIKRSIDTTIIQWQYTFNTSLNPIKKIQEYTEAKDLKNVMDHILAGYKNYSARHENVYNLKIRHERVKDTLLLSSKKIFSYKPGVSEVYDMIEKLKIYIHNNGVKETNFPMLNVRETGGSFETMVAIPIEKRIKESDDYVIKRMIPGDILVTEITGGSKTIEIAFKDFDYYISDYNFSMPAIPFELLVTDRTKEPDTAKWVTRLYYPIL